MLSRLIADFENLCHTLVGAVRRGDEQEVSRIDEQLMPLMRRIFSYEGVSRSEISEQLSFFAGLAVRNCEDDASVRRYTGMMVALTNRYLDQAHDAVTDACALTAGNPAQIKSSAPSEGYDLSVTEMILDTLPERVAVIGRDYRYIYVNEHNARFHDMRPSEFIGRHLSEMIGDERFTARAKGKLDQCFDGAVLTYTYEIADRGGRRYDVHCRMTPLKGPDKTIVGAVLVLSMQPLFARVA